MSDDLNRLRATMSELAEHGGSTDLYQRALDGSRRLGRRRAIMSTSAVAVAVLAIATPIALAQKPKAAPLPAAPAVPAPSPSPASVPSSDPHSSPSPRSPDSSPSHPANGCPVSASILQKVAGLDAGYQIDSSSIACEQNWATAGVTAPTVEQQGDGLIFFEYSATTGTWTKKGEGSSVPCGGEMGIPASTGFCSPDA
jgi:hypothetical protein